MSTISWALNVQVAGGPEIAVSNSIPADAYDKIQVIVEPGVKEKSVDIQPGSKTKVYFLLIKSSLYSSLDDPKLTYKVSSGKEGEKDSVEITLDDAHMYLGAVISTLLPDPKILKFTNNHPATDSTKKAVIEVLVGRKV